MENAPGRHLIALAHASIFRVPRTAYRVPRGQRPARVIHRAPGSRYRQDSSTSPAARSPD
jgi:hypothetical protein